MKKRKFDHIFRLIIVASIVAVLVWGGVFGYEYYKKHLPVEPTTPSIDEEQNQNTNVGNEGDNGKDDNNGNGNGGSVDIDKPVIEDVFINDASMFNYMTTEDGEVIVGLSSTGALKSSKIILPVKTEDGKRVVGVVGNAFLENDKIEELIIPGSYKFVGEFAFSGVKNLKCVYIGLNCLGTVTNRPDASAELTIGAKAFKDCVALEEVYIYKTVSAVDGTAFVCADNIHKFLLDSETVLNSLGTANVLGASVIETADIYVESVIDNGFVALLNSRYLKPSEVIIDGVNYNYYECKGKVYTLTIDTDGGKISGANEIYFTKYDDVRLPIPTKDHYEFSYYSLSNGKSVCVPFVMCAGIEEDIIATAKYIPVLYKVTYELNGGENNGENIEVISIISGSVELKDAVKADYTFEGWYLDDAFTQKVTSISYKNLTKNENGEQIIKVFAKFIPTDYSINYELNGGENNSENIEVISIISGSVELKDAVKADYTFEGWYLDDAFTQKVTSISYKNLTKNENGEQIIKLFAKFIPTNYSINYELDGGENNSENIEVISIISGSVELKNAVKADYTFEGWYLDGAFTQKVTSISIDNLTIDENGEQIIKVFAKFLPTNYSINYELDGGENNSENAESINVLSDAIELKDAYKYGFLFEGWYLDAEFTKQISTISFQDLVIGEDGNKTLSVFAKFGSMFNIEGNVVLGLNDRASSLGLEDIEISKRTVGLDKFEIGESAFVAMSTLKVLRLGEGVRYIREDAFRSCYNLETITMEYDGYTDIMPNAFVGCTNLKDVIIDGAKTIFVQVFDASTLECTNQYAFYATSERLVLELTASYSSSEIRQVAKVS